MRRSRTARSPSLLQRARAALGTVYEPLDDPDEPVASALLGTYMRAFGTSDVRLLERTLRDDAMLEMTPARTWYSGRVTCLPYLATVVGQPGEWSMRSTRANGQPAAVAYRHGEPFGVAILGLRNGGPCPHLAVHRLRGAPPVHARSMIQERRDRRGWQSPRAAR